MQTRQTDSKGRLTLGESFANRTVLIDKLSETELKVTLARVIPESEAWLYDNPQALQSVRRGLKQAHDEQFVPGPELGTDDEAITPSES